MRRTHRLRRLPLAVAEEDEAVYPGLLVVFDAEFPDKIRLGRHRGNSTEEPTVTEIAYVV